MLFRSDRKRGFIAENMVVLKNPWALYILLFGFIEYSTMFGAFAYIGADLHARFNLSFTIVGLCIGMFAFGGLIYAGFVKVFVARLGQTGLARFGGLLIGLAYLFLVFAQSWWQAPIATVCLGLGFYMLHNTLQTNATQMSPEARGTALGLYSAALYLGQTVGVAIAAPVVDRAGAPPIFITAAVVLAVLGSWVSYKIKRRSPLVQRGQ